jgi:hypothetical protein
MSELERRLVAAAPYYPFPETPAVASAARARLGERPRGRRVRVALAFALAVALVGGVLLAASPGARSAILDLLDRVPGIQIERRISLPEAGYTGAPNYGIEMGLDEAEQRFGRPLRLPRRVGEPQHVYWLQYPPGDMITAIYGGDDRRAELVFSQWKTGGPDLFYKALLGNTEAEAVQVDGAPGLWIHGGEHLVWFLSPDERDPNVAIHYSTRGWLAGNVLAWRVGDVVYRLEADVPLDRALEVARTLEER